MEELTTELQIVDACFLKVMHKVAARSVRAKTNFMESTTKLSLVLRVSRKVAQFAKTVGELTLITILAATTLLEGPAELCLVARGRFTDAAVELAVLLDEAHETAVAAAEWSVSVARDGASWTTWLIKDNWWNVFGRLDGSTGILKPK